MSAPDLGEYEGYPIVAVKAIVRKTGDGLSKSVKVQPQEVKPGAIAHLAVRVVKVQDRYDFVLDPDTGEVEGVEHVQIFDAIGVAFADGKQLVDAVTKMTSKIDKAERERKNAGQGELAIGLDGLGDDVDAALRGDEPED